MSKRTVRSRVWERDGWRCRFCGQKVVPPRQHKYGEKIKFSSNTATIDHLLPRSRGGLKSLANCVTSCWSCNHDKADLSLHEFLFGNQPNWRRRHGLSAARASHVAKVSKRLHTRIQQTGNRQHALKDLHLALLAEAKAS